MFANGLDAEKFMHKAWLHMIKLHGPKNKHNNTSWVL